MHRVQIYTAHVPDRHLLEMCKAHPAIVQVECKRPAEPQAEHEGYSSGIPCHSSRAAPGAELTYSVWLWHFPPALGPDSRHPPHVISQAAPAPDYKCTFCIKQQELKCFLSYILLLAADFLRKL